MTERKAFWKSKGFWGGLGSILTGLSIIFTSGRVSTDAVLAIGTGTLAVYGRVVADSPLAITDHGRSDGENADAKETNADRGN